MGNLKIKSFIENSLIDWEGRISAVIFLGGCNFSCPFCHNATLVKPTENIPDIPVEKILHSLKNNKDWLDGVVISGGEPCLYAETELTDFIKAIKNIGLAVKIDTNGSRPQILENLIKQNLIDCVAMDIKAPLNDKYRKLSGANVDLDNIRKSVDLLRYSGIEYEFRTTFVPTLLDKDDLVEIASYLKGSKKFYIQAFNPQETLDQNLRTAGRYPDKYLEETLQECIKYIPNCGIRR